MASVSPQSGILMNSQYIGRYRFFAGRQSGSGDNSSPPYVVPVTLSLLTSQSLFLNETYSPGTTLIIPFYRIEVPHGYAFVIFMQAVTALLVKWAYTPTPVYMPPLLGSYQAIPDFEALRQISSISQSRKYPRSNQNNSNKTKTLKFFRGQDQDEIDSDPLLPEGLAINLSFLAPFSSPDSRASSLYTIELTLIRNIPGYFTPILTLIIYFVLKPFIDNKNNNKKNNNNNNNNSNNSNNTNNK